jgi:hypothetical protein
VIKAMTNNKHEVDDMAIVGYRSVQMGGENVCWIIKGLEMSIGAKIGPPNGLSLWVPMEYG